ncbi:MAG TPA: flagellar hook-basal body complex protein FliE [Chthonomonadaceae bacterium]|nr:flagellar hook-basal body complex protein FliE [Chthonomonadaceae bacterium]
MQINSLSSLLDVNPISREVRSGEGASLPIPGANANGVDDVGAAQGAKSFGQYLQDAIGEVNQAQLHAGDMAARFAAGEAMDVHQVMIAAQEASTALSLAIQVRNKLVDAYQEVMRVSV